MSNIKKYFFSLLFVSALCTPIHTYALENYNEVKEKEDANFIFFEESSSLYAIDLAIEISKTKQIEDSQIFEEIKKETENKAEEIISSNINAASVVSYIMSKNYRLSKEEANQIYNSVIKYSNYYNVDPYLILAVIEQESTFKPNTEYKGAYGLMQIYHSTMPYLGITMAEVYDIDKNIRAGVKEISGHFAMFGDQITVLSAYNWGSGNVKRGNYNTKYANSVLNRKANIERALSR